MVSLASLWLPILAAAVAVFIASSIIHMATAWHHNDFKRVPDQDRVMDALRSFNLGPGDYVVPRPASRRDEASPEFAALMKRGPVVAMTVLPGNVVIAKNLVLWFVYCIVVALCAAYIAGAALPAGAEAKKVFQFGGATAFFGFVTAGVFAWLWP